MTRILPLLLLLLTALPLRADQLANPALGIGLNEIRDYSTQSPFIDLMKSARAWIGHRGVGWGGYDEAELYADGYLDARGWPLGLPDDARSLDTILMAGIPPEATSFQGRYRVTWEGTGRLQLWGAVDVERQRETHTLWFTPRMEAPEDLVALSVLSTDPRGIGDPIRNIVVVQERHIPAYETGEIFNPEWIALIEDMRLLRFMDWMDTNVSTQSHWNDRPEPQDRTWASGVPVEVMVALANRVGADPWFNMPHMADDAYIRRFASVVRDSLDSRLIAHVEYSNEFWNFGFPQAHWLKERAHARLGTEGDDGWMQEGGVRAARMARIWKQVYGDDAPERMRAVLAVHTAWLGLAKPLMLAPRIATGAPGAPPPPIDAFDAYAISGYIGHDLGAENAQLVHSWLDQGEAEAIAQAIDHVRSTTFANWRDQILPFHADLAAQYGLPLLVYEGGSHVAAVGANQNDPELTGFFERLSVTPEMAALYDDLLAAWHAGGGTLFTAFVDVEAPSRFGAWGHLRHLTDSTPRWDRLMAFNRAGAWWGDRSGAFLSHRR